MEYDKIMPIIEYTLLALFAIKIIAIILLAFKELKEGE